MKAKKNRIAAKGIFAFLSILLVPIYTITFGTNESPVIYTLSNIGNFFDYRLEFIIWGIITGAILVGYVLYTYKRAEFADNRSRKYLLLSDAFLVLTVLTPALKEIMKFWYYVHLLSSTLFVVFFLISILFFMHYLALNNKFVYTKSLFFLSISVGIPVLLLFVFGSLTGIAEISFFVLISIFLIVLNIFIAQSEQKNRKLK